jgi:hypothetical protein
MGSQPTHRDIIATVAQVCSDSITELEAGLKAQVNLDKVALDDMEKVKDRVRIAEEAAKLAVEEATKLVADHAEKERQRFAAEMQLDTYSSKHTWSDIQEIHDDDDDREEEEEGNNSAPEDICIYIFYSLIQSLINTIQLS